MVGRRLGRSAERHLAGAPDVTLRWLPIHHAAP